MNGIKLVAPMTVVFYDMFYSNQESRQCCYVNIDDFLFSYFYIREYLERREEKI